MFKFIHTADIHLDSPLLRLNAYEGAPMAELRMAARGAFENLVNTAIANQVDFVLVAGDLFDGDWKDYNTGLYFVRQTSRLQKVGIPVYIAAGNHDAASRITRNLRWPSNVHLFSSQAPTTFNLEKIGVAIHGQSYPSPSVLSDLTEDYPPPLPDCFNIGVLHTCMAGSSGHEPYAPCTLSGLHAKGYDYWALGHVHTFEVLSEDPWVVFCGNLQGRHIRECGPKGCVQVSVDDSDTATVDFIELDVIRWHHLTVDATGVTSGYDLVDRFGEVLEKVVGQSQGQPLVTRVSFCGSTSVADQIVGAPEPWISEIRSMALNVGGGQVWVEKTLFHLEVPKSGKDDGEGEGAVADLIRYLKELKDDPDQLLALGEALQDLEKRLPREVKVGVDAVDFSNPAYLQELLDKVRPLLIGKLISPKS